MIYLSIILTIICLILLSFLIGAVVLIKKYGGKMSNFTKNTPISSGLPPIGDSKQMEESMKMISNLMKNFGKK
jgi:NADH:ubiquinone oxidoreductase subunit 3 (subunit A)